MKKVFALIGMVVCALFLLTGLLTIGGSFDGSFSSAYRNGMYDAGYASFGADYYTYSNNNAADAAEAARTAAGNLRILGGVVCKLSGILFMGLGGMGLCHFGVVYGECTAPSAAAPQIPAAILPTPAGGDPAGPCPAESPEEVPEKVPGV